MGYIDLSNPALTKECRTTHQELFNKQVPISEITSILRKYIKSCDIPFDEIKRNDAIKVLFTTSILLGRLKTLLANMNHAVQQLEKVLIDNPQILENLINKKEIH